MNKKGAALAIVLIVAVVLALFGGLMFTIANASVSTTDAGIKSREAHANAKSGYDYVRALASIAFEVAREELNYELNKKIADSSQELALGTRITRFLGYCDMNENGEISNFVLKEIYPTEQINENDLEYKNARIQVSFDFERTLSFAETDQETKAGTFTSVSKITSKSTGRSNDTSSFSKVLGKGISLDFVINKTQYGIYHGDDIAIDSSIIPGTDKRVTFVEGLDFDFENNHRPDISKGQTIYYQGNYYMYINNGNPKINKNNLDKENGGFVKLLVPPAWDLTGWDGKLGLHGTHRNSMNNYLRSNGKSGDLMLYEVVKYGNEYYVYYFIGPATSLPTGTFGYRFWIKIE